MIEGQEGVTWEQWRALACAAEGAGLEGLFRSDHYLSILRGAPAGSLDAWATLAAMAAVTDRIRLGTMVSPVTFRPASVLAKNAVTVDHVSGGRVELGIGAGWYEAEHELYGFAFGSARSRMDELDRQLAEIHGQWADGGDAWPKPVQRPRPPIIVGGAAKPRSVDAAIAFADEYNTTFPSVEDARARRRVVDEAAREAGRRPLVFSMMCGCVVGRDRGRAPRPALPLARPHPPARDLPDAVRDGRRGRRASARVRGGGRRARDAPAPDPRGPRDGRPPRRPRSGRRLTRRSRTLLRRTSAKRPRRRTRLCTRPGGSMPGGSMPGGASCGAELPSGPDGPSPGVCCVTGA